MKPQVRPEERGEGRIGCFISLILLALCVGLAVKIVPVYYSNDQLADFAEELCGRAGTMSPASVAGALNAKAVALDIPEAAAKGAMEVTIVGDTRAGSCSVHLKYTRKVDLYGAYLLPVDTDKKIMKPFLDNR